jgi:hypothetical protein
LKGLKGGSVRKNQIAVSVVALLLLATGCQKSNHDLFRIEDSEEAEKFYSKVGEKNIHGQWEGKSAPYLKHGGWSVAGDFIYWRADEDGLEYAKEGHTIHRPRNSWDAGFKAGIGYTFGEQDFWDLFLRWTYFQTHQTGEAKGKTLLPWWSPTLLGPSATKASADWTLHYNTLDLELGRDYFLCKTIALRPHLGLRGALIKQHYDAKYDGVFLIGAVPTAFPTEFKAENKFAGAGVRVGAQLAWHFTREWAVTGSLAGALLYGHFDVKQELDDVVGAVPSDAHLNQELSRVAPNLEAGLGIQWETFFHCDRYRVAVSLGYEFTEWFSQNQMSRTELIDGNGQTGVTHFDKANGDLGLQGATLEVRFDF